MELKKNKKYIVILIDGAADYRLTELGNKTPLQVAKKPVIDYLARNGIVGIVRTIPVGMQPGSDTANLSILGYDPKVYSTGRSSLEAASIGINLSNTDATFRCNLVTLSDEKDYFSKTMVDYSAGEITTEEARILILDISKELKTQDINFYPGVSYRHVIVWKNFNDKDFKNEELILTPPHDISGKKIKDFLPRGKYGSILLDLMIRSSSLLENHYINRKRIKKGKKQANSIWIWAKGKKPKLDSFYEKYRLKGAVISAVDLVKGIGVCAGLEPVYVKGATGNINTNFKGKAKALINEIKKGKDFIFLHIEAPDETSHQGNVNEKIRAIEIIDREVIGLIKRSFDKMGTNYRLMVLPDHPTPITKKTHTAEPVPFLIFDSNNVKEKQDQVFDEFYPYKSGIFIEEGHRLIDFFLNFQI